MLGGSFAVSFLRNGMGAFLMLTVFFLLDRPRFSVRRTVLFYSLFGLLAVVGFSVWYLMDFNGYVHFSGLLTIPVVGIFCILMSRDNLYLSLYKLTLGFYLLAVSVFCGVNGARLWFGGSLWADIAIRVLVIAACLLVLIFKIRRHFLAGVDFLCEAMDVFSGITLVVAVLVAGILTYAPGNYEFSIVHVLRVAMLLLMAGIIQWMAFSLYLYRGRAYYYRREKALLEMNERLLRRQVEQLQDSKEANVRINSELCRQRRMMEEYIKNNQIEELLDCIRQYGTNLEGENVHPICDNATVDGILSVYEKYAREEGIRVAMQVRVGKELAVREMDLAAILIHVFENAIHGCEKIKEEQPRICLFIHQKKNKVVIQCKSTCVSDLEFGHIRGSADRAFYGGAGVLPFKWEKRTKTENEGRTEAGDIMKVIRYYNGEADIMANRGVLVARILLNVPA